MAGQLPGARAHGAAPGGLRGGLEAPRGPAVRALRSGGLWGRADARRAGQKKLGDCGPYISLFGFGHHLGPKARFPWRTFVFFLHGPPKLDLRRQ